jgi:hypothetical protein
MIQIETCYEEREYHFTSDQCAYYASYLGHGICTAELMMKTV